MTGKRTHTGMVTLAAAAVLLGGGVIAANTTTKKVKAATTDYVKVLYAANLRQGPGLKYATLRTLNQGEAYKTYTTQQADGYTWYNLGGSQWVADAAVEPGTGTPAAGSATGPTTTQTGWVTVNTAANLRSGAGLTYGVVRGLSQGEAYKYFATKQADGYTWYNLGGDQWVAGVAVTAGTGLYPGNGTSSGSNAGNNAGSGDPIVTPTPNQTGSVRVNYAANIRQGAGTSYAISKTLAAGGTYSYTAAQQADGYVWYCIGNNEWIASAAVTVVSDAASGGSGTSTPGNNVTPPANQTKVAAVIALAQQQLGKPYVWGGKGPDVFDCSGLMYYIFLNAAGVNIGGWTVPQESSGKSVSLNALQPGDIIFWGPRGNTYHDALYIGNNQYIAAPEPGDVVRIQTISPGFAPSMAVRVL